MTAGCCGPEPAQGDADAVVELMFDDGCLKIGAAGLPHDHAKYGAPRAANEEVRAFELLCCGIMSICAFHPAMTDPCPAY